MDAWFYVAIIVIIVVTNFSQVTYGVTRIIRTVQRRDEEEEG